MNLLPGSLAAALVLASLPFVGTSALAEGKDTVISVQSNPLVDPKPACVVRTRRNRIERNRPAKSS
jgi:hypothetical protein